MTQRGRMCVGMFRSMAGDDGGAGGGAAAFTCGAECDEGLRVLADHPQLVSGEGQPSYDVLHKVVGGDRRHVPLQLPQYDQFPVLKAEPHRQQMDHRVVKPPPPLFFFSPGKGSAPFALLAVSYYPHAFLIPRILWIDIAGM